MEEKPEVQGNSPIILHEKRVRVLIDEISASSNDVVKQAGLYLKLAEVHARYGFYDEAVIAFNDSRDRYIIDGYDINNTYINNAQLTYIEGRLKHLETDLGHENDEADNAMSGRTDAA